MNYGMVNIIFQVMEFYVPFSWFIEESSILRIFLQYKSAILPLLSKFWIVTFF